jgi:hypothetical protein
VPLGAQAALGLRLPAVTAAAVRRGFTGGKDASMMQTARRVAGMPMKRGVPAATTAGLKLFVLQKISTSPKLVLATLTSSLSVVLVSAQLGDQIAIRAEPSARKGAGCRRVQAGQHQKGRSANRPLQVQRQAGRR